MGIRTLRAGDPIPAGEPRRYLTGAGYIKLRWKVGVEDYVEVYEHRFVMGMPDDDLQVHHRNRGRRDNRPENLVVLSAAEHRALHDAEDRPEFERRMAERGGYRSRAAQQKAERAAARRAALHRRALAMRAMYEAGSTTTEIGDAFGIHSSNVSIHLRRVGTEMRPFSSRSRR
ncbi:HNH endonuclease [Microbacterium album]|uniref:HNH nuclease domain-containing protein n=1 Tax=Microbacterium album TaxID=2053191 RepID=A0A917IC92_9MICO|nr:HNH endonuclease [Microbacterium album]GGH33995.1 hypothetical protein GCM10010921_01360 [Microbacterium album]